MTQKCPGDGVKTKANKDYEQVLFFQKVSLFGNRDENTFHLCHKRK